MRQGRGGQHAAARVSGARAHSKHERLCVCVCDFGPRCASVCLCCLIRCRQNNGGGDAEHLAMCVPPAPCPLPPHTHTSSVGTKAVSDVDLLVIAFSRPHSLASFVATVRFKRLKPPARVVHGGGGGGLLNGGLLRSSSTQCHASPRHAVPCHAWWWWWWCHTECAGMRKVCKADLPSVRACIGHACRQPGECA